MKWCKAKDSKTSILWVQLVLIYAGYIWHRRRSDICGLIAESHVTFLCICCIPSMRSHLCKSTTFNPWVSLPLHDMAQHFVKRNREGEKWFYSCTEFSNIQLSHFQLYCINLIWERAQPFESKLNRPCLNESTSIQVSIIIMWVEPIAFYKNWDINIIIVP